MSNTVHYLAISRTAPQLVTCPISDEYCYYLHIPWVAKRAPKTFPSDANTPITRGKFYTVARYCETFVRPRSPMKRRGNGTLQIPEYWVSCFLVVLRWTNCANPGWFWHRRYLPTVPRWVRTETCLG